MTRALRRALSGTLGGEGAALLCSSFDQVGEIAIIRIPAPLLPRRREIGEAVLAQASGATRVFCQASDVSGEHRTRDLELIAGEGGTVTVHRARRAPGGPYTTIRTSTPTRSTWPRQTPRASSSRSRQGGPASRTRGSCAPSARATTRPSSTRPCRPSRARPRRPWGPRSRVSCASWP